MENKYSILIVDDDEDNITILQLQLRNYFSNIITASDGQKGLAAFGEYHPDIVLTDIRMPNMNGMEMSKRIREVNKQTIIIVLSAFDDSDLLREAITSGVNNYILKPFNKAELLRVIEKSINDMELSFRAKNAGNEMRSEKYDRLEEEYRKKTDELLVINELLQKEIQDRRLIEADLVHARSLADSANRAKDRFIANMSHELRTPLNGVIGLTSLLFKTGLDKKQYEYIKYIQLSARTLLSIVNDILDMSSIEAGKFRVGRVEFNLRNTIEYVLFPVMLGAKKNNIKTEKSLAHNVPPLLFGDEERLKQVLNNLLSNALKFTHEGSITLSVAVQKQVNTTFYLRFSVTDTGIGISSDGVKKIFQRFVQVDDSPTRKYGGTGLGLYITKQIVDTLGGEITVESAPGVGTEFSVVLPFEAAEEEKPHDRTESIEEFVKQWDIDRNKFRILVCEDNDINREMVFDFLSEYGYRVDAAANGKETLELCSEAIYDLILLDLQYPDFSGYDLAKILREPNSVNRTTTIVALTAHSSSIEEQKCLEAGMDGFLSKPIDLDRLEAEIVLYLKKGKKKKQTAVIEPDKPQETVAPVDFELLKKVVRGNIAQLKKYIHKLLDYYPDEFEQLRNAVKNNDLEKVRQLSHRLKATFGNFNAKKVVVGLQAIYDAAEHSASGNLTSLFSEVENDVTLVRNYVNEYINTLDKEMTN